MISSIRKLFVLQLDDTELSLLIHCLEIAKEHCDTCSHDIVIDLMIKEFYVLLKK